MNKKYKKSWKSLPHIAKLTISNKFWDEPYPLGRIDDHISFTVAKKHHSIKGRGLLISDLKGHFGRNNTFLDFNKIDEVFDLAKYIKEVLDFFIPQFYDQKKYAKKALKLSPKYYQFLSEQLKSDFELCRLAMKSKNGSMVKHIPQETLNNLAFAQECISCDVNSIRFFPRKIISEKCIQRIINAKLDEVTCLSTTKVLSDEQFLIATHHRNWLFNMSRFLKNNNITGEDLLRHLDTCNMLSEWSSGQGLAYVPLIGSGYNAKNILNCRLITNIDKFLLSPNYPVCLKSIVFSFACLTWEGELNNFTDKMESLTVALVADGIAKKIDGQHSRKHNFVLNAFEELSSRIKKKHNPFALVTIKNDSQIGAILNEIIERVFNLINFQKGCFEYSYQDFAGNTKHTKAKINNFLLEHIDIPF